MQSPLPMDVQDINVCLLSAKKKSTSSPSLRELDQMSLCNFPTSTSVSEDLASIGSRRSLRIKRPLKAFDTQSMDISFQEHRSRKIRRPFSSFANIIKESPLGQARSTLKRSLSFTKDPAPSPGSKYRIPGTPKQSNAVKRRRLNSMKSHLPQNWSEMAGPDVDSKFTREEIKRQEAIYSIFKTESELVEDLKMVINIFYHPMLRLNLITEEEHCRIFGNIQTILSLHEGLVSKLEELRSNPEQIIDMVGATLLEWSQTLSPYSEYCAHLVTAKHTLEAKKLDPQVDDFLQRCLDSEFSRKIELWTFLDSPRARIMKYPILLKEVKKKTPSSHGDHTCLDQALVSFESVIKDVDRCTGVAKCLDIVSRLDYLHDDQRCPELDNVQFILCSGVLRNKNGSKLHAFLFDRVFVLTRQTSRPGTLAYQVYRQPIPVSSLMVEDISDGDARIGGSFRGTLKHSSSTGCKHLFKVSCSDPQITRHSHTLQANGDFDKKAWIDAFKSVVPNVKSHMPVSRTTTV